MNCWGTDLRGWVLEQAVRRHFARCPSFWKSVKKGAEPWSYDIVAIQKEYASMVADLARPAEHGLRDLPEGKGK